MEERKPDLQQIKSKIRDNIMEAVQGDREEKILEDLKRRLIVSVIFLLLLMIITYTVEAQQWWAPAMEIVLLVLIVAVNHRVFIDGFTSIYKKRPEKNTLAAIGTIAALAVLQFQTAGIFLTTMALCRWSEAYVNCKLDEHLKALIEAEPEDSGLQEGDIIVVRRKETFPADGVIIEGATVIDDGLITGERVPINRKEGNPVFAGTKNLGARIKMRVTRTGEETAISQVIDHITASIATKAPISAKAEKAGRIFVLIVILLAMLSAGMLIAYGLAPITAVMTAVTILIIASPYTFSVGIPMAVLAATVRGAKEGILIRSADILELARDINTIAVNKTGTVTSGKPEISDVLQFTGGFSLRLAGALEKDATHPVGREIYRAAMAQYGSVPEAKDVAFIPGRGLCGEVDGQIYLMGNELFMEESGISTNLPETGPLFTQGKSVVFASDGKRVIGVIALRDGPKPISLKAISQIENMGIDVVMLTGESTQTAEAIRNEVGIDRVLTQLRPEEKAWAIKELGENNEKQVAMVGDGKDDIKAIEAADIGFAIGTGLSMNIGPADVILIDNNLTDVVRAIQLSRKTMRYIRQNIAFAYCYNILAILAAVTVFVPAAGTVAAPALAALCMCISQVLVIASAMRIKTARL